MSGVLATHIKLGHFSSGAEEIGSLKTVQSPSPEKQIVAYVTLGVRGFPEVHNRFENLKRKDSKCAAVAESEEGSWPAGDSLTMRP